MNLKSITDLPVLNIVEDTDNLIVNSAGSAKQATASAIIEKITPIITTNVEATIIPAIEEVVASLSKRELVYEFNPGVAEDGSAITDVNMFGQNINDDLTWLTNKVEGVDFEIILNYYGLDVGTDEVNPNIEFVFTVSSNDTLSCFATNGNIDLFSSSLYEAGYQDVLTGKMYAFGAANIVIYNKLQIDMEEESPITTDIGGMIGIDGISPIKSIKIYKITH